MKKEFEIAIDDESVVKVVHNKTPEMFKWSMTYIFNHGGWKDIARVDNYPHRGRQGVHIHRLGEECAEFREITYKEAKAVIKNIGKNIKGGIKDGRYRDSEGHR